MVMYIIRRTILIGKIQILPYICPITKVKWIALTLITWILHCNFSIFYQIWADGFFFYFLFFFYGVLFPQSDSNTSFLRAARAGNVEKVLEFLKSGQDISTCNQVTSEPVFQYYKKQEINAMFSHRFPQPQFKRLALETIWREGGILCFQS